MQYTLCFDVVHAHQQQTGTEPAFIMFFDCPEDVMTQRLLGRNQGRSDDNIETIKKRFKVGCGANWGVTGVQSDNSLVSVLQQHHRIRLQVFLESSMPVVGYYESKGKVYKIPANRAPDDVYADVRRLFL